MKISIIYILHLICTFIRILQGLETTAVCLYCKERLESTIHALCSNFDKPLRYRTFYRWYNSYCISHSSNGTENYDVRNLSLTCRPIKYFSPKYFEYRMILYVMIIFYVLGTFFFAHMMLGESRLRLDFRLGTWPKSYRWSVKDPFCSRSRLHPTKII